MFMWRRYVLSIRDLPKRNRFAELYKKAANKEQGGKEYNFNELANAKHPPNLPQGQYQKYHEIRRKLNEQTKQQQKLGIKSRPDPNAVPDWKKERGPKNGRLQKRKKNTIRINIPKFVTVSNLATLVNVPLNVLMQRTEILGFDHMTHNYILDQENAALIADEFGFEVNMNDETGIDVFPAPEDPAKLRPRPPVVTIMGHVDHGKTTILDYLRKSSIVKGEHGGITQHIGAFSVVTPSSKKHITFLDTPGHAAFLSMRERGAIVTDIVILVVAADDSVMPQTIEAIRHAKKAGVPIIVAINKCDKPGVNIDKVLGDLARYDIDIEDYGGETQTVRVSGLTGMNMDKLEEAVITLSELSEFQAEKDVRAEGWIIESLLQKGLGNVLTVLVRRGTVKPGSFLVAGTTYCRVRGMRDENGKHIRVAGPSVPVQIWGWKELPQAGDHMIQTDNETICRKAVANRIWRQKQIQAAKDIETINEKRQEEVRELQRHERNLELKMAGLDVEEEPEAEKTSIKYIVRSDVFGSAEAIKESVDGMGNDEVTAVVISHEAGPPTDSDVDTAEAVGASILCFNMDVPKGVQSHADRAGVEIKVHKVIYRLIEDVTAELTALLKPHIETTVLAAAEIKHVFNITKNRTSTRIGGCKVTSGTLKRANNVRVMRNGEEVYRGRLTSLKHVKQDISEAVRGLECGIAFDGWDKFAEGDLVETYEEKEIPRYL